MSAPDSPIERKLSQVSAKHIESVDATADSDDEDYKFTFGKFLAVAVRRIFKLQLFTRSGD
jgi:hypothetical protein